MQTEPRPETAALPKIRAGDLFLFTRKTLGDVADAVREEGWRALLPELGGWLIGLTIAVLQRVFCPGEQGHADGFWEGIHSAMAVELPGRPLELLESTANRHPTRHGNGVRIVPLDRIARYRSAVTGWHLSGEYAALLTPLAVARWYDDHAGDQYRFGGLPFALLASAIAWDCPGYGYCSEEISGLLLETTIIPRSLPVLRGKRRTRGGFKPQCIAPCELARKPQYQRESQYDAKEALCQTNRQP